MRKLKITVAWFDNDLLELSLSAASEGFSGRANFYASLRAPMELADLLEGFPLGATDVRQCEFGQRGLVGHGGASIRLWCNDSLGHLKLRVGLFMDSPDESATVALDVVPAELDEFVDQLRLMKLQVGHKAVLGDAS